jgi:two-component sensor histidine kinase
MSLLARLLLLIIIAVLPALGILLYNRHDLRAAREAETHAEALRHAHAVADELQRVVDGARDLLLTIAHAPPVRDGNWSDCNSYLDELGNVYPSYSRLTVADLSGRTVCTSEPVPPDHSMAARRYFQEALASGEFTVGTFAVGRRSGDAILPFAAPFRDRSGRIAGVVIDGLRLEWLAIQVGRKLLPPDGTLMVADRDGTILTRRPDPERWIGQKMNVGPLYRAGEAGTTETFGLDGVRRIYGYVPPRTSQTGLHVVVGIGTARVLEPIFMASDRGVVLVGLAGLLALITGWFGGSRFIRRPIRRLIAASYQLGVGDYRRAALPAASGDFGALNRAFEAMAETLASREAALTEALERNQALLREGNHRIKNNLQLVSSLLGLQRGTLRDAGARLALQEAKQRIQAIARVHEGFYRAGEFDRVEFSDFLRALCDSLVPGAKEQTKIVIDAARPCVIPADRATSLALIANEFITNALKHAFVPGQCGSIVVRCAIDPSRVVVLTVADDGRGLPESFDISVQSGFGLRLVQTLARQIGGEVRVRRRDPGTLAEIRITPPHPVPANGRVAEALGA